MKNKIIYLITILSAVLFAGSRVTIESASGGRTLSVSNGAIYIINANPNQIIPISNVQPLTVQASNLTVYQTVTNDVAIHGTVVISNAVAITNGGALFAIVSNQITAAISAINSQLQVSLTNITAQILVSITNDLRVTNLLSAKLCDTNGVNLNFHDGYMISEPRSHLLMDKGESFFSGGEFPQVANGSSAFAAVMITNYSLVINASAVSEGKGWIRVYEINGAPTNGTVQIPRNRNRVAATNGIANFYTFTTASFITNWGTQLLGAFVAGGGGANSVGTEAGVPFELKLAPSKWYVLQFSNTAGSAKDVSLNANWYREAP